MKYDYTRTAADSVNRQMLPAILPETSRLCLLDNTQAPEVLEFLKVSPVHTVVMTSFVQDNGLANADNRGKFYGYRNTDGRFEGVALIGHTTLIEARSDKSLTAFARVARRSETPIHFIMAGGKTIEDFWQRYADDGRPPRLVCSELLFELNSLFFPPRREWDIRLAVPSELEVIARVHDEVAFIESGRRPMAKDRSGFLKRCLKRIEQNRTFVVFRDGELIFKADIAAETSETIYLEGVYVAPEMRGRGVGANCLSHLSLQLLKRVNNLCLLSNIKFKNAHRSFTKAGYKNTDQCEIIFV